MISQKSTNDPQQLRPRVQKLLDHWCQEHRVSFHLTVLDEIVQQDEWTYLMVVPKEGEVHAYQYANALSQVETKLRRDEHVENVLLVPALED